MSRNVSPSPLTSHPSSTSIDHTSRPSRPPKAPLRVETALYPSSSSSSTIRARSNSAQSHSPFAQVSAHHFSRSLSHTAVALSPTRANDHTPTTTPGGKNDVALAVNGLRGMLSSHPIPEKDDYTSPISPPAGVRSFRIETEEGDDMDLIMRIQEALSKSTDEGNTLDLSRRGIKRIGEEAVEMFRQGVGKEKKGVWRLALSYNALSDGSLVDSFSRLSRLRYLNLKGNALTEFPPALSDLPTLEILDLSKNKIQSFPASPGRLDRLKVLSLTSNKLYTLPSYLASFSELRVLKVDLNPIEWPPREVLGVLIDHEARSTPHVKGQQEEDMKPWLENMKSWMRQKAADGERVLSQNKDDDAYLASEEEPVSAVSTEAPSVELQLPKLNSESSLLDPQASPLKTFKLNHETPRARSPLNPKFQLGGRNRSATLSEESLNRPFSPDLVPPVRPFARHDRSTSGSSYEPPPSASTTSSSSHSRAPSTGLPLPPPISNGHSRGASYTAAQRTSGGLTAKKSLPDLRQSHAKIMQERRHDVLTEQNRPLGLGIKTPNNTRYQSSVNIWNEPKTPSSSERPRTILRMGSADMLRQMNSQTGEAKADSTEGPLADESRNSYFRRLSTLPASTLSKAIPPALLLFVDATRGILFALSQLHSSLRQYLAFAVKDRVAGVFNRVMEPAGTYMNNLINALDRFDSMSRRSTPPPSAIKAVIDTTRESVAVTSKIISVLRLQMPALRDGDVRYARTLLLMIYGSMAEVGYSWRAMEPLIEEIKPLLSDSARMLGGVGMVQAASLTGRTPISPIPERGESRSPSSAARSSISTVNASPAQITATGMAPVPEVAETPVPDRGGRNRRQGGSFSMQDVERGMLMGSPGAPPGETSEEGASYMRHRPSASATIVLEDQAEESEGEEETLMPLPLPPFARTSRSGSASGIPVTPPELTQNPQPITLVPNGSSHARRGHHASSSAGSLNAAPGPLRKPSVDIRPPTPASATLYDEDLLDVIETATDIAFTVWLKLAEDINSSESPISIRHQKMGSQASLASTAESRTSDRPSTIPARYHTELVALLSRAEQVTTTLRETLAGVRANLSTWSTSTLPDDAQMFIKTVVKVSELVKIISATHSFPQGVRQSCSRLTQATRECAILIQVSSLRPGASTPAPMPMSARPVSPNYRPGTADSSAEDLTVPPHSAGWMGPPSAASISSSGGGSGLRGLQLPSRHAARARGQGSRDPPRSAQPS